MWADSNESGFQVLLCSFRGRLNMAARGDDVTVYNATKTMSDSGRREGY